MADAEPRRTPELDQVRQMLFPRLSPEDGWARIDRAFERGTDPERIEAVERLVRGDANGR
jgi:hypothetical protein